MKITRTVRPYAAIGVVLGASALVLGSTGTASAETPVEEPASFTSAFTAWATPDMVINADGQAVPGEEGAEGMFSYRINSDLEIICYDITLTGVTPPYESPAKTATHIHQAAAGAAGPPRIAFPNPEGSGDELTSSGCLQGPFTTGILAEGVDTGTGFELAQIEADPAAFFTDTHTAAFAAGAVRGQLQSMPVGGVDTGLGGTAQDGDGTAVVGTALGVSALVAAGLLLHRRRASAAS